jgi:hypothetical protein
MRYRNIQLFVVLLIATIFQPLSAQITIKDTLVISPVTAGKQWATIKPGGSHLSSVTDTFLIAPYSGVLRINYPILYKRGDPPDSLIPPPFLPTDANLAIQFSDTTYAFLAATYFPQVYSLADSWDVCGVSMSYILTWFYTGHLGFAVREVNAGDTVRFTFHGHYVNPTEEISGSDSSLVGDSGYAASAGM